MHECGVALIAVHRKGLPLRFERPHLCFTARNMLYNAFCRSTARLAEGDHTSLDNAFSMETSTRPIVIALSKALSTIPAAHEVNSDPELQFGGVGIEPLRASPGKFL